MKTILIFCLVAVCLTARGQEQARSFCDTASYHLLLRLKGDVVTVSCDSVYFMNAKTLRLLMEAYDGYRRQTEGMGDVFLLTDAYRKRLDEQQHEYDSLHTYFDQLSKSSDQLAQRTMGSMAAISNNLDSVSADLNAMHSSISGAQKAIISTRRNSVISKVLWASAGVLTGVLITTLIVK